MKCMSILRTELGGQVSDLKCSSVRRPPHTDNNTSSDVKQALLSLRYQLLCN